MSRITHHKVSYGGHMVNPFCALQNFPKHQVVWSSIVSFLVMNMRIVEKIGNLMIKFRI